MKKNEYAQCLKRCGLKNTSHRTAVLSILDRSERPMAAEEVYLTLKEADVSINLSTVYRTLETLAGSELIKKLTIVADDRTLYEFNRMVHRHYLVCLECKKILSIDRCPLENYEKALEQETHFTIAGHKLDIYGYCPECSSKGARDDS